jgi:type VI secretion system secreted protein Hcp
VSIQDFSFMMRLNRASPGLMQACATGKHIKTALLSGRKAGKDQTDYLTFKFSDVLVTSYQTGGTGHADVVPTDQVSLSFAKIEVEYKQQRPDGSHVPGGQFKFDLKTNKPF